MINRTHSKWISLFVIVAVLVSMLLMQAGIASAATLQPIINPAGGAFATAQTVTIYNIANGDTAYYTTDGTNPESSNTRIVYSGPFTVYQSETIQAAGYDSIKGGEGREERRETAAREEREGRTRGKGRAAEAGQKETKERRGAGRGKRKQRRETAAREDGNGRTDGRGASSPPKRARRRDAPPPAPQAGAP